MIYTKKIPEGVTVNWSASAPGYIAKQGSFIMPNSVYTLDIFLRLTGPWTIFQTSKYGANYVLIGDKKYYSLPSPILKDDYDGYLTHIEYNNTYITVIDMLDARYISDASKMFKNCSGLYSIPYLNTSSATNMDSMFYGCTSLKEAPDLETGSVTNMERMFYGCTELTSVPAYDYSNVTRMAYMFNGCTSLKEAPVISFGQGTVNCHSMFNGCTSLTSFPDLDFDKVSNGRSMFNGCTSLTSIPPLNCPAGVENMFSGCTNLKHIWGLGLSKYGSSESKQILQNGPFPYLTDLYLVGALNGHLNLDQCPSLSVESVKSILTAAANRSDFTWEYAYELKFANLSFADPDGELAALVEAAQAKVTRRDGNTQYSKFTVTGLNLYQELASWKGDSNGVTGGVTATVSGATRTSTSSPLRQLNLSDELETISFANNTNITSLDYLVQDHLQTFENMFSGCTNLRSLPIVLETGGITSMRNMFSGCTNLESITVLDFTGITDATGMFSGCTSLIDFEIGGELSTDLDISDIKDITTVTIKSILEAADRKSNLDPHTLTFANLTIHDAGDILANLVASCESKNWTIIGLTFTHLSDWLDGTMESGQGSILRDPSNGYIRWNHISDPTEWFLQSSNDNVIAPIHKSDHPDYYLKAFNVGTGDTTASSIYPSSLKTITYLDAGFCDVINLCNAIYLKSIGSIYGLEYHPCSINFTGCSSLESIGSINTRNLQSLQFEGCSSLVNLPEIDTRNVETINFFRCSSLKTLPVLDCSKVKEINFDECSSLESLGGLKNYGKWLENIDRTLSIWDRGASITLDLSYCPLTTESLHNLAESLYDMNYYIEGYIRHCYIRLNPDIENNLTSEDRALLVSKGWEVRFSA